MRERPPKRAEIARQVLRAVARLNQRLRDAHAAGLEIELDLGPCVGLDGSRVRAAECAEIEVESIAHRRLY